MNKQSKSLILLFISPMIFQFIYAFTGSATIKLVYGLAAVTFVAINHFGQCVLSLIGSTLQKKFPNVYANKTFAYTVTGVDLTIGLIMNILLVLGLIENPNVLTMMFIIDLALNNLCIMGIHKVKTNRAFIKDDNTKFSATCMQFACIGSVIGTALAMGLAQYITLPALGGLWLIGRVFEAIETIAYTHLEEVTIEEE